MYLMSNYIRLSNHNRIAKVKMPRGTNIVIRARGPILPVRSPRPTADAAPRIVSVRLALPNFMALITAGRA